MRLNHILSHVEQQLTLCDVIAHAYHNFTKDGVMNLPSQGIHARLSTLKDDWEQFSLEHKAIIIAVNELSSNDKLTIQGYSYFSNNLFAATHERYVDSLEKLNVLMEKDQGSIPSTSTLNSASLHPSGLPVLYHHARLPRIDLPKFNGTPSDWLSFKDLFSSLVINNIALSPVEKLQYLKTSLTGSAALLLKNTTLSADNFHKAWEALISYYENKRLLVNAALQSLLSLKRVTRESAIELEKLYTQITQIYSTFENLNRAVTSWDDFLIFIVVQRLDSESVKAWEQHLGSSKELPSWATFNNFLVTRLLSLKAYEKSRAVNFGSHSNQQAAKVHYHGKLKDGSSITQKQCHICSENHYTMACPQYINQSIQRRLELVKRHKLCYNCLGLHRLGQCKSTRRCQKCAAKHHTTIHQPSKSQNTIKSPRKEGTVSTSALPDAKVLHSSIEPAVRSPNVLLATALVRIITSTGDNYIARALVDQGSEISLITERLVQRLCLPRTSSNLPLVGIGAQKLTKTKGLASITVTTHFVSGYRLTVSVHILSNLTLSLPSVTANPHSWSHLNDLELADPNYNTPSSIDIVLGADAYSQILEEGLVKGPTNAPIAQKTRLGWILSGPMNNTENTNIAHGFHVTLDLELRDIMRKFWTLEEFPLTKTLQSSVSDKECEDHFLATHSRDKQGRYVVQLPFKHSVEKLGESRSKVLRLATKLRRRLEAHPDYACRYSDFLQDYVNLKHMQLVPDDEPSPVHSCYLPHHGVVKEQSLSTKLRVVFNGSSLTSSGYSLNDILHTGKKLQTDLFDILIWFRQFRYVFTTDVEKMFRQIKLHPDHWAFQRILWINSEQKLLTYELTTVTYGLVCAPYIALRVFLQLLKDEGFKYPLAVPILQRGRYVDDIFGGADSIEQVQEIIDQLIPLCMAGGFNLQKWTSNHPSILKRVPTERCISDPTIHINDALTVHTLGLCWQPSTDMFQFSLTLPRAEVVTKRVILSTISKLFDPLGFLSPITISAKILIQELWSIKRNWDDPLPEPVVNKWQQFMESLQDLKTLTFPRSDINPVT